MYNDTKIFKGIETGGLQIASLYKYEGKLFPD
jgi:hypothetical protein